MKRLSLSLILLGCDRAAPEQRPVPPEVPNEQLRFRACEEHLLVEDCVKDPRCVTIEARGYDPERPCVEKPQPMGCMTRGTSCPTGPAYAAVADGRPFEFADGCVPGGWERIETERYPEPDWPSCE